MAEKNVQISFNLAKVNLLFVTNMLLFAIKLLVYSMDLSLFSVLLFLTNHTFGLNLIAILINTLY